MLKLLRASFFRLVRSRVLLLCMAAAFAISSFFLLQMSSDSENTRTLDEAFLQVLPFLPVLYAVFIGLFLGIEYQDGTMRNKLIAGHARSAVYVSQLLAAMTGCLAILLAWALSAVVGVIKFGWFTLPWQAVLLQAAAILLQAGAMAAILTVIAMLVTNRAISGVASILAVFALLLLGSYLYNALCEPELMSAAIITENGFEVGDAEPNPMYIGGTLRTVFQFFVDTLPSGQAILLANQELAHPGLSLCASVCIALLTTGAGILTFKRKNLK